jgi:hypothetical protein
MENKPESPAPIQQLVGQLRELTSKATSSGNGWKAEPCGNNEWRIKAPHPFANACCPDLSCENNIRAIVAVFNALPTLLAIAEAAQAVQDGQDMRDEDETEWAAAGTRVSAMEMHYRRMRLARALSLPPIAGQDPYTDDMHIIGAWQDIEDAPRDGSVIIGATYDRRHICAIFMKYCDGDMEGAWVTERSNSPIRWNPQCWTCVPPNAKDQRPATVDSNMKQAPGGGSGASTCSIPNYQPEKAP